MPCTILDDELLTKIAVYWPPGSVDEDGERTPGTAQEIACHWEHNNEEMIDDEGKTFISSATVYMASQVLPSGWLWLSTATVSDASGTALAEAPATPPHNQIIKLVERIPDIDNDETMWRARI